ncbi:MAG: protein kinase, partial [Kangiellaceae bacterium]|nr:protein kinase [Kangiellaceae bacterium]
KYIPASRFNKMVTPWIDGALKRATRIDPRMRYDSLSEFWNDLEHPNPRYAEYDQQPLMEREPVRFWQIFFVISLMANFYLLFLVAS